MTPSAIGQTTAQAAIRAWNFNIGLLSETGSGGDLRGLVQRGVGQRRKQQSREAEAVKLGHRTCSLSRSGVASMGDA